MPGFWKLVLVAAVALLLYGRSGVHRHPVVRALLWGPQKTGGKRAPDRRTGPLRDQGLNVAGQTAHEPTPDRSRLGTRAFILLVVTAATAVAALIVTRALILSPGLSQP